LEESDVLAKKKERLNEEITSLCKKQSFIKQIFVRLTGYTEHLTKRAVDGQSLTKKQKSNIRIKTSS